MVFDAPNPNCYACAACNGNNGNKSMLDNMSEEEIAKNPFAKRLAREQENQREDYVANSGASGGGLSGSNGALSESSSSEQTGGIDQPGGSLPPFS
jgi:hypothetical protein